MQRGRLYRQYPRIALMHRHVLPPENRKVGGSTPPLATTKTAGQEPLNCGFVVLVNYAPIARPTASDRDIARMATSYRTSYRAELRSEALAPVMSKVQRAFDSCEQADGPGRGLLR